MSDLSGRGVGLDVVNSQLQAMNGSVAISTVPKQSTTFSLKIPLSLTITKLLVCQAHGFAYALPVERVEQVVVPRLHPTSTAAAIATYANAGPVVCLPRHTRRLQRNTAGYGTI